MVWRCTVDRKLSAARAGVATRGERCKQRAAAVTLAMGQSVIRRAVTAISPKASSRMAGTAASDDEN